MPIGKESLLPKCIHQRCAVIFEVRERAGDHDSFEGEGRVRISDYHREDGGVGTLTQRTA